MSFRAARGIGCHPTVRRLRLCHRIVGHSVPDLRADAARNDRRV